MFGFIPLGPGVLRGTALVTDGVEVQCVLEEKAQIYG
jgi:hypothetical protein